MELVQRMMILVKVQSPMIMAVGMKNSLREKRQRNPKMTEGFGVSDDGSNMMVKVFDAGWVNVREVH